MDYPRDTRILVTGGGGLLGTALRSALQAAGFSHVEAPPRSDLDLQSSVMTRAYLERSEPECVIHLASIVFGLLGNMSNQFRSLAATTEMNSNLFGALHECRSLKRVFFSGTVASYPYPYKKLPLIEADFFDGLPHSGEFGYATAKRHAYSYLRILADDLGVPFTYGIFTNLYGEQDRFDPLAGHVIPSLVAKAYQARATGSDLSVWGSSDTMRDFLYAGDAASAVIHCLDREVTGLVNISSGQGTSIGDVARTLAKLAGISRVDFDTSKPVGIPNRLVDNAKLLATGFRPRVSISEGLSRTFDWYARNIENGRVRQ